MRNFTEIQCQYFTKEALSDFWINLRNLNASIVKINLNTETATLEGVIEGWEIAPSPSKIGVRHNAYETMIFWGRFAQSVSTDAEYESLILNEALSILQEAKLSQPSDIQVLGFSIDGNPCLGSEFIT